MLDWNDKKLMLKRKGFVEFILFVGFLAEKKYAL